MARHYYLTRAGRLRRKDNTLCFEPSAEAEQNNGAAKKGVIDELFSLDTSAQVLPAEVNAPVGEMDDETASSALAQGGAMNALADDMGDLALEAEAISSDEMLAARM